MTTTGKTQIKVERSKQQVRELEDNMRAWVRIQYPSVHPLFYLSSQRFGGKEVPAYVFAVASELGLRALVQKWFMRTDLDIERMKELCEECVGVFTDQVKERANVQRFKEKRARR